MQLRRGNNAIEFALILPVLLTLIFGAMEYSWYFVQYEAVARSASQGARAGSQIKLSLGPTTTATSVAKSTLSSSFSSLGSSASVTSTVSGGNTINVTITVPYKPLVRYLPTPASLTYSSSMRLEDLN